MFLVSVFFNSTATTENYTCVHTLSLHDALPICAHADEGGLVGDAGVGAQRLGQLDAPGAVEGQLLGFREDRDREVVVGFREQGDFLHAGVELLQDVDAAALHRVEIGRASCRSRVCQ